ncbi:hypothetical protein IC232_30135 [Microvirga sp. BT688]|uniref:hypothetical protein n=1 Tax=Microvirga sp. TaxID=1873136 RepID=UPI00168957EA|nr:hypothetical protein [Microvirga sp.]MBD2750901.1 hypothetical protein [Microvirga sp.]
MSNSMRLLIGFAAGFLSHLIIEGALGAGLYAAGLIPSLPWSLAPVGPLRLPQSLSLAFWAGLFGVLYVLMEPWLTAWLGQWQGGFLYGLVVPLSCDWFIVLPLKGHGIGGGFHPAAVPIDIALNAALGLGAVVLFWWGLALTQRWSPSSPEALRG